MTSQFGTLCGLLHVTNRREWHRGPVKMKKKQWQLFSFRIYETRTLISYESNYNTAISCVFVRRIKISLTIFVQKLWKYWDDRFKHLEVRDWSLKHVLDVLVKYKALFFERRIRHVGSCQSLQQTCQKLSMLSSQIFTPFPPPTNVSPLKTGSSKCIVRLSCKVTVYKVLLFKL